MFSSAAIEPVFGEKFTAFKQLKISRRHNQMNEPNH